MNTQSNFHAALVDDARAFVTSKFGGNDMSGVPADAIKNAVEKLYDGGWVAYERDFRRFNSTTEVKTEAFSPIKQKSIVEAMCKIRLRDFDDIVVFNLDQSESATFVVSRASVIDRRSRRDIVSEREITLYKFTRTTTGWTREQITITESVNEIHHRFGAVNTVERAADKKDQYENCYRPGSERTPLQGWVARLEMSWKQAHESEVFQSATKESK